MRAEKVRQFDVRSALWLWPYLGGMSVITALGQYHGFNKIPFWWDLGVVAVFSLGIYMLAVSLRLPAARAQELIEAVSIEAQEEIAEPEGDVDAEAPLAREAAAPAPEVEARAEEVDPRRLRR